MIDTSNHVMTYDTLDLHIMAKTVCQYKKKHRYSHLDLKKYRRSNLDTIRSTSAPTRAYRIDLDLEGF